MKFKKQLSVILAFLMLMSVCMTSITVSAEDELPFTDVKKNWAYEPIKYVWENGLMNGTGGTNFSPGEELTRAMVVTVLYRLEGSPRTTFKHIFMDVEDRKFYSEAVVWAKLAGIVTAADVNDWGDEWFAPTRVITRQELATMFLRYAKYKYINTDSDASLDKFTDKDTVASWASDAMVWATSEGIINGTGDGSTLSPKSTATRDQFATIIYRFNTTEFKYDLNYSEPKPLSSYTEPDYPLVDDADLYVAVDGSDKNPGTIDKPLATFEGARNKVRELKKTANDEIVVAFKAGDYGKLDNVIFTADDAGTESVPIKYCKYGDGDVIFRNGVTIKEKEFKPLDDSDRDMFKTNAQPHIYKADLSGRYDKFSFNTRLFSEFGQPIEAREPNANYYTNVTTTVDDHKSIMLQHFLPSVIESFKTIEGLKMNGFLRAGYVYDIFPVLSYDKETKVLTFDFDNWILDPISGFPLDEYPLMYEGRTDDLTFFSNLAEFVDAGNEYWFDNKTSTLYVYMARGDYFISDGGTYVTVEEEAEYLTFTGFEFDGTNQNAFVVYADHFTLDMCKIGNVGGLAAVNFPDHVRYLTIKNSEFYNCVDHCIYLNSNMVRDDWTMTDNKRYLIDGHNVITNNYFHDFTLPEYFSSAISITDDVGTEISHNYFYEGGHGAIRYNMCIDMKIEYNVFDNIMTKTQDYGAVYTWEAVTYIDNHIRYNIFKNIPVYAIYLDNDTAGQLVYGNVFYNNGVSIVQNGGRANYIFDNVFLVDGTVGYSTGYMGYKNEDANPEEILKTSMYKRYAGAKPQPGEDGYDVWLERWPELYLTSFDIADYGKLDCIFTPVTYTHGNAGFDVNIVGTGEAYLNGAGEKNRDYTTSENPFFVNPSVGDYSIREGADFVDNHYSKIGRY